MRIEMRLRCFWSLVICKQTKVTFLFLDRVDRPEYLDRMECFDRLECLDRPEFLVSLEYLDRL